MKYKSIFLLLIFSCSLIPLNPVLAEETLQRSLDDAISLMYVSDAILFGDVDQEEASRSLGLFSPVYDGPETDLDNGKLAAMIHAAKMERNDLDKNCEILINQNRKAGKDCEADRIKESCAARKAAINVRIGKLHKLRGDRRRPLTKGWHFLKRQGRTAWHKLGPSGRRFFHKMGPDLMQMVATGGFSGSAFKTIFKAHLKRTFGKKQISKIVLKGIQRRMMGQMEIAQAAGVDICEPEKTPEIEKAQETTEQSSDSRVEFELPDSGVWDLSCQHTDEFVMRDYPNITWKIKIYWDSRLFEGVIEADHYVLDENPTTHSHWFEEGGGTVTTDGYLWGDFIQTSTNTVTYENGQPHVNTRSDDGNWIGVISEDLDRVCLYRIGASEWFTVDWLRERGRQEMLSKYCEGLCYTNKNP